MYKKSAAFCAKMVVSAEFTDAVWIYNYNVHFL